MNLDEAKKVAASAGVDTTSIDRAVECFRRGAPVQAAITMLKEQRRRIDELIATLEKTPIPEPPGPQSLTTGDVASGGSLVNGGGNGVEKP